MVPNRYSVVTASAAITIITIWLSWAPGWVMKIVACCSSSAFRKPVVRAANPMVSTAATAMHHHGERVEKSLIRSTAITDMSVVLLRPGGQLDVGDRGGMLMSVTAAISSCAWYWTESPVICMKAGLERATLQRQLVQDDALRGGRLTDLVGGQVTLDEQDLALVARRPRSGWPGSAAAGCPAAGRAAGYGP